MPGSYFELYLHLIWAVKNREHLLIPEIEKPIFDIIKRKAAGQKARVIAFGNTTDHIHLLVSIHPDTVISTMLKEMKAASSYYVNQKLGRAFYWQEGYGALTVSKRGFEKVRAYVQNQKAHHAQNNIEKLYEISEDTGIKPIQQRY